MPPFFFEVGAPPAVAGPTFRTFGNRILHPRRGGERLRGGDLDGLRRSLVLEECTCLFGPEDRAFLSDGWGDVLILFGNKSHSENQNAGMRLREVFEIQNSIFEDFQVDRTELILTPDCLRGVLDKPDWFDVSIQVRLVEDRELMHGNALFVDNLHSNMKTLFGLHRNRGYRVDRMPGRTDYTIEFLNQWAMSRFLRGSDCAECASGGYDSITALFMPGGEGKGRDLSKSVDIVQTNIGYRA